MTSLPTPSILYGQVIDPLALEAAGLFTGADGTEIRIGTSVRIPDGRHGVVTTLLFPVRSIQPPKAVVTMSDESTAVVFVSVLRSF